ncbi:hypothetical protein C8Q76DRAFT_840566 [Earliella scabrosa]|nr:hypothetical protein C8Q76DRAFT_840566 [Earliella scabrosa]
MCCPSFIIDDISQYAPRQTVLVDTLSSAVKPVKASAKEKGYRRHFQLANVNKGIINADCTNLELGQTICLGIFGQDCQVVHIIGPGQTCESIARAAGTTVNILLANNPNVDNACTNLEIGQVLCTADDVFVSAAPPPPRTVTETRTISVTTTRTLPVTTTVTAPSTNTTPITTTIITMASSLPF